MTGTFAKRLGTKIMGGPALAVALTAAVPSGAAFAMDCVRADLGGRWTMVGSIFPASGQATTVFCEFRLRNNGRSRPGGTCRALTGTEDGFDRNTREIVSMRLTASKNCAVGGTFNTQFSREVTEDGLTVMVEGSNRIRLRNGQMNLDKNSVIFTAEDRSTVTTTATGIGSTESSASNATQWIMYKKP
ncbi:MAG: hypothetical protein AAF530_08595 [Pseudomonadota bacterium]